MRFHETDMVLEGTSRLILGERGGSPDPSCNRLLARQQAISAPIATVETGQQDTMVKRVPFIVIKNTRLSTNILSV